MCVLKNYSNFAWLLNNSVIIIFKHFENNCKCESNRYIYPVALFCE